MLDTLRRGGPRRGRNAGTEGLRRLAEHIVVPLSRHAVGRVASEAGRQAINSAGKYGSWEVAAATAVVAGTIQASIEAATALDVIVVRDWN